ncbi:NUDIX hydrolase [Cytobacillus sp. S13-E01]|uniref:NUDIX domain-containing protein n=1 Tax=Cytobacillus sp. S13-E01 TaxID=3031326 RepID=UPI0023D8C801|nr:NUDIX hydrolase [Cytobacillus sp. S13-E01]MDF0727420.1 NUDIX hydrolase [Cytobacillus sp. S13-E01]
MNSKRGNVWLAVAGLVISDEGEWLVVKKRYGGLKGKWSLPAGFVEPDETVDQAVIREVKEETGVSCMVQGVIGVRSGVIRNEISDNMIIFSLQAIKQDEIIAQESELLEASFVHPKELLQDTSSSVIIKYLLEIGVSNLQRPHHDVDPGNQFGYTSYKLFF